MTISLVISLNRVLHYPWIWLMCISPQHPLDVFPADLTIQPSSEHTNDSCVPVDGEHFVMRQHRLLAGDAVSDGGVVGVHFVIRVRSRDLHHGGSWKCGRKERFRRAAFQSLVSTPTLNSILNVKGGGPGTVPCHGSSDR